ncbi:hypothetical protein TD95_001934 [Thielaviopsis punctulata]|uniref:Chromatin modification-related protein EAF3 n=1 Tax=Thielaviopsis punctulata TaxID=72032 RepID=A0A0F4ZGK2_9PEZI|nr:hypothetical protein TD95_001934 [Thielaviopsis punctulata]
MAPSRHAVPPFVKDERVLCFHHEMLYEAKVLDVQKSPAGDGWKFKVHYKGWKNTWDDWVTSDRMRKFTDENKDLANQLQAQAKTLKAGVAAAAAAAAASASATGSGAGGAAASGAHAAAAGGPLKHTSAAAAKKAAREASARGSEERGMAGAAGGHAGRGPRRARDYDLETEDAFHARPAIKLPIEDTIKARLVDDWELVTKSNMLVPVPHAHPVGVILKEYLEAEKARRVPESASWDILHEVVAGLREYFEKALGKILLYRFERPQYHDMIALWEKGTDDLTGPCDTYGVEHLVRLLVSLPELVAQTNMDQQSVARLREELSKFSLWLARHAQKYFAPDYESPSQSYVDRVKLGQV